MYKTVALACDHAGFSLKNELMLHLSSRGIEFRDFGTYNEESCDYPVYGERVGRAVASGQADLGIAICGTGVGISRENAIARSSSAEPVSECRSRRTSSTGSARRAARIRSAHASPVCTTMRTSSAWARVSSDRDLRSIWSTCSSIRSSRTAEIIRAVWLSLPGSKRLTDKPIKSIPNCKARDAFSLSLPESAAA